MAKKNATELTADSATVLDPAQAVSTETAPSYQILNGVPLPAAASRAGVLRGSRYPFDELQPNGSFFVPATPEMPNPAKTLASTVSSQTRRYGHPDPSGRTRKNNKGEDVVRTISTRQFTIRPVKAGQTYPGVDFTESADGARIFRIDGTPNARTQEQIEAAEDTEQVTA